jgi:hypothetical protein
MFTRQGRKQLAKNIEIFIERGKKNFARLAFVFLLAKQEFHSHLATVICTPDMYSIEIVRQLSISFIRLKTYKRLLCVSAFLWSG